MSGLPSIWKSPDVSSQYHSFDEQMQVLSPATIWIIFRHHVYNTPTLWSNVTLKKSTDTEFTLFDIRTLSVATTAQHQSSPSARLMQSIPSNPTTLISTVLLSLHVQLVLQSGPLYSVFLTNSFSGYFTAPIQVTFPTHPYLSHASKSIKLTQTLLDWRLWWHNHSKYYCLILLHLSHKQKIQRILRLVVHVSTTLPRHHKVAILDKQTTLKHYTTTLQFKTFKRIINFGMRLAIFMRRLSKGQSSDVWYYFAYIGSTTLHILLWILLASGMRCCVVWQTRTAQSLTS